MIVLGNTHTKKQKVENWSCNKKDDGFTLCHYKTKESKNIEISTPISLEVWLFWCEKDMLFLDPKWLAQD